MVRGVSVVNTFCEMFGAITSFKSFIWKYKLGTIPYILGYQPLLQSHFSEKILKNRSIKYVFENISIKELLK